MVAKKVVQTTKSKTSASKGTKTPKGLNKIGTIYVTDQSGRNTNVVHDKNWNALKPGKRRSRTGKIYWETRKNRSDKTPSKGI